MHRGNSQRIEHLLQEGYQSDAREDYRSSVRIYDTILQIEPDQYIALVNRGRAKINLGDTLAGLAELSRSIKIHPTPEAFASKAVVEYGTNPAQAFADLKMGNQILPNQALITGLLAQCYTSIHPLKDSALYYADLTCRLPTIRPSLYIAVMNAYLQYNDYPNLIKTTDSIIVHYPGSPYPYNNRGLAKLYLGDIQGAKQDIRISLSLDPTNAWAYRNMGLVFEKMDSPDSSCLYFQMAREKDKKQEYKRDIDSLISKFCK